MNAIVVDSQSSLYKYEVTKTGLVATKKYNHKVWAAGPAKEKFSWDDLFAKAWGKLFPDSIANAVAAEVLDRLLGPDQWQKDVTDQLKQIIAKLDDILDEIRSLKDFIRDNERNNWRTILNSQLTARVDSLQRYLQGVKEEGGELQGNLKDVVIQQMVGLENSLGEIANYRAAEDKRPLCIPLYAAVKAGLLMLVATQRIANIPVATTQKLLATYGTTFHEWRDYLSGALASQNAANNQEATFLRDFPKRSFVQICAPNYAENFPRDHSGMPVYVVIDGGLDKPFSLVGLEEGAVISDATQHDPVWNKKIFGEMLPAPYQLQFVALAVRGLGFGLGSPDVPGPPVTQKWELIACANKVCDQLNARRNVFLSNLEETRKLAMVQKELDDDGTLFLNAAH